MNAASTIWAAVVLTATSALALDYTWLETAGNNQTWDTLSCWRVEGEVPGCYPNAADDNVSISYTGNSLSRMAYKIYLPSAYVYAASPVHELEINRISCAAGLHPILSMYTSDDKYSGYDQVVTVSDPDGFDGFWTSEKGRGKLILKATASHVPFVKYLDVNGLMGVEVPDSGTSAEIGSLVRAGALNKSGAGTLTIDRVSDGGTHLYVNDGTLVLKGVRSTAAEPTLPAGSVLHLDATKLRDVDLAEESYGSGKKRTNVTVWRDCDGGAITASVQGSPRTGSGYIGTARAPYLAAETSTTGNRLIDFGLPYTCATEDSPSNCCFQLSAEVTAKEAFYVARNTVPSTDSSAASGSLLSGVYSLTLQGGGRNGVFGFYASDAAMHADVTINGCPGSNRQTFPTRFNGADLGSLSVVSIRLPVAQGFNAIATDRNMVAGTGGWQVGEILVYDRDLTEDERNEAIRFLMKKWHAGYVDQEAGELVLHADSAAIEVPAGRVARVGNLSAQGCTKIVKRGEGLLSVEGIAPTNVNIQVVGGSIAFATPVVTTEEPAANPMLWLDATKNSSFVFEGGDTAKITRWNDWRGTGVCYAEIPPPEAGTTYHTSQRTAGHYPKLISGQTPGGYDAVSFGTTANASWMWLQPRDQVDSYAAFVVHRVAEPMGHNYCIGSSNNDLLRYPSQILSLTYTQVPALNARWAIDGRAIDPWFSDQEGTFGSKEWRVQSYAGSFEKIRGDLLAQYAVDQDAYVGNVDIAEVILYDRPLTDAEIRATEAYLMDKWLVRRHPAAQPEVGDYEVADDIAFAVDNAGVGATTEIRKAVGGNGSIVKTGAGAVSIGSTDGTVGTKDVTVEAGALAIRYPSKEITVYDEGAAFHFDASDISSFTFGIVENGDGTSTTNVLAWRDQRDSSLFAKSDLYAETPRSKGLVVAHPTFRSAEMPNGRVVQVVDFGSRNSKENASALTFYRGGQYLVNNVAEIFVVFADQRASDSSSDYLDSIGADYTPNYAFLRGSSCQLLAAYAMDREANANMISVNGVQQAYNAVLPAGFHVVSYRPAVTTNTGIECLGRDRNSAVGGGKIAEILAFTSALTDAQREGIIQALTEKWLQYVDDPVEAESISVANGASFDAGNGKKVITGTLSASGASSLTCGELDLTDGASLTIDIAADGTVGSLNVSGPVVFAGAVDVSFTVAKVKALDEGTCTVLTAPSLEGFDAALWSVDDSPFNGRRFVRFYQDGNAIKMSVTKAGLSVILR